MRVFEGTERELGGEKFNGRSKYGVGKVDESLI
jgi:hypothetical protein